MIKNLFILVIILSIPTLVILYDLENDIANTFPEYEDNTIVSSSSGHEAFIHQLPAFTGILLNVEKTDAGDSTSLQIFLMSKTTYDLYREGKALFGHYIDTFLLEGASSIWLNTSFDTVMDLYLVIRVTNTEVDQSPIKISMEFIYDVYVVRKGVSLFFYLGLYIIGVILTRGKVTEFRIYRAIKKYEDKRDKEEEEFLDRILGPLDDWFYI